jgi:DNA-binding response OmpR family regulator
LVVEDDRFLLDNLRRLLTREGYDVVAVSSGEEALNLLGEDRYDLVVLDLGLPGIDGIATCRRLRTKSHIPVLMLTARTDAMDKVLGLEVGADDYLTKPFEPAEFMARVRAQLRRHREYQGTPSVEAAQVVGDLKIDPQLRDVLVGDKPAGLTNREYELVAYLAKNLDRAISRDMLFEQVWGYDMDFNTNSLDVYMYRIRKKLEIDPNSPRYLHTMRGYGYKMVSGA